jgi:hypothetical protein
MISFVLHIPFLLARAEPRLACAPSFPQTPIAILAFILSTAKDLNRQYLARRIIGSKLLQLRFFGLVASE